jgi:hypothetical protein
VIFSPTLKEHSVRLYKPLCCISESVLLFDLMNDTTQVLSYLCVVSAHFRGATGVAGVSVIGFLIEP